MHDLTTPQPALTKAVLTGVLRNFCHDLNPGGLTGPQIRRITLFWDTHRFHLRYENTTDPRGF